VQVCVEEPLAFDVLAVQRPVDRLDRIMAATARPEPIRSGLEPGLPLGLQRVLHPTSSGPFTPTVPAADTAACPVVASNLPFGSNALPNRLQRLTRPTSAPFQVRASARYPASYAGAAGVRPDSRVPVAFRPAGVGFLGHPVPAKSSAILAVGLPGTHRARTLTGFPRSACARCDRGGCPLCPGTAVFHGRLNANQPPPAAPQRPVLHPGAATHPRGSL
jgi:hypothetical protein